MFTISHTYSFESYCLETKMKLQLSCSPDAYSCSCTLWYRGICHILYNCVNCTLAHALADKCDRFQRIGWLVVVHWGHECGLVTSMRYTRLLPAWAYTLTSINAIHDGVYLGIRFVWMTSRLLGKLWHALFFKRHAR